MEEHFEKAGQAFAELVKVMAKLRAPGGCPWDRKQTFDSIKAYLLEETYEVLDAIDRRNWAGLQEELGDLLLQPVFLAEMAAEEKLFTIADSLQAINEKLVRRHPHVFGEAVADTSEDVKRRWDEIKQEEKRARGENANDSILQAVPRNLPALVEAEKIGKKVAAEGFDWPDVEGVLQKVEEEARELAEAHAQHSHEEVEHELGDLLFNIVNLARYLKVDPEQALRGTNQRFRERFAHVERRVLERHPTLRNATLEEMETYWQEAKKSYRRP